MSMKTQRDAFVTSLAKFTLLHSAADMKPKNIDAIKGNEASENSISHIEKDGKLDGQHLIDKEDHLHFWFPLLAGLSELTFDLRP
ncbi:hypothetical protein J5N97_028247 [Dioscorea zingiberensis]|uniref:Uncharacterized protein n=1 Tax=Dioscorea zingiberensis TaxID=325984 RepID=A0A9D5BYL8_9LILI|nr:hypothetical protein J5N97_028247 [Dioscorea zingiberensis]